jgi:GTP-binding protein
MIIHLLDLYRLDQIFSDYEDIRKELELFSQELTQKEELIVFSKADLLDEEMRSHILEEFSQKYPNKKYFIISAATGKGIEELKDYLVENIVAFSLGEESEEHPLQEARKVFDLRDQEVDPKRTHVEYLGNLQFRATGKRLEQIVRMTDFENMEAVMRVYDVLEKIGIVNEVKKKLESILKDEGRDNSFFFEGSDEDNISPKILI